jgi:hypothetical protein
MEIILVECSIVATSRSKRLIGAQTNVPSISPHNYRYEHISSPRLLGSSCRRYPPPGALRF